MPCSLWEAARKGWRDALMDEMRLAEGTLAKYEGAVSLYSRSGIAAPRAAREADVRRHIGSLRHLAPSTVRVHLCAIKSFHQWLDSTEGCGDPTKRVKGPKRPERLPNALTERECVKLLQSCDDSRLGVRDRALMECFYSTGCRASEVLNATMGGLELSEWRLRVIGKGNRERMCLLGPSAVQAISEWVQVRLSFLPKSDHIFLNHRGKKLSIMGLWKMLQARAELSGITRHIHPHMFRHACASHMLRHGADIRSIQLILGHRNLNSTQVYLSVDDETLRAVHASAHPRGGASEPRLGTVGGRVPMDGSEKESQA